MIAVDTNVVVRLLTDDDRRQAAAARSLFASEPIWIAKTVFLETAWILRSLYGFDESAIRYAFIKLLGLKNVHAEDERSVANALAFAAHGIELADAFHLSSRPPGATFVSFDQAFVRRAIRAGAEKVSGVSLRRGIDRDFRYLLPLSVNLLRSVAPWRRLRRLHSRSGSENKPTEQLPLSQRRPR